MKPRGYWTKEACRKDALLYSTRSEWEKSSCSAYVAARKRGWLDECCAHMMILRKRRTLIECQTDALQCKSRIEWQKTFPATHYTAFRNGWLDKCCAHMTTSRVRYGYWTMQTCIQEALKYTTQTEWKKRSAKSHSAACSGGWLKECIAHMTILRRHKWTLNECLAEASKYRTKTEWSLKSAGSYSAAKDNRWMNVCCAHMKQNESVQELYLMHFVKNKYPTAQKIRLGTPKKGSYGNQFELDIYIPELNKGIELNGDYWHSPEGLKRSRISWTDEDLNRYHDLKRQFFKDRGIVILEIWESEWIRDKKSCLDRVMQFIQQD